MSRKKDYNGLTVNFVPSKSTARKFSNPEKESHVGIILETNEKTVDIRVFDEGKDVYIKNVPHISNSEEGRSCWTENKFMLTAE